MAMIGKVKRMHFREKKSVREIVRLTSLSRNTVRKWLKAAVLEEPRYRRSAAPGKLTPFHVAQGLQAAKALGNAGDFQYGIAHVALLICLAATCHAPATATGRAGASA